MPKRTDLKTIMIIGSGPIIIGQACEFDYSGTQACKALKEEGYRVVLVNSNPATIMTDPEMADRTYIEPITPEICEKIISKERPDALLPTLGGQTALNTAVALAERGVLEKYNVELIGAKIEAIKKAEDRDLFKKAMEKIGLELPRGRVVQSLPEARLAAKELGLPLILRPSFTMGGTGGNIVWAEKEMDELVGWALSMSPTHSVLVEESIIGWKEYELEVMRDAQDNVVIICPIENFDPMGIHTGDSITVAPAMTLTDKEYQILRNASIKIIREIGVDTGGSNIQFAIHPKTGRMVVIEMNPRVSRSSALASKATGFPIAKIATKLAVGYSLNEITNDITRCTPASFEPTIDYVVVKIPRFTFEKFADADSRLTTQMKSVGEAMAMGRTFKEALGKAIRSLEIDRHGLVTVKDPRPLEERLKVARPDRLWAVAEAFRSGIKLETIAAWTQIDRWFLDQIAELVAFETEFKQTQDFKKAKQFGLSDIYLAEILESTEDEIRRRREGEGIRPVFKRVDTCAAEFEAHTPYLYSSYEDEDETAPTQKKKIAILGGGPNRIGQGIEFDYCCVHASYALREAGYETIMINCNPETVSTDYDTSDRLYFEPLTKEDVLAILDREKPEGVIVQLGGQTPLKLAIPLEQAGIKILGTSPDSIDRAEDRERFADLVRKLGLAQPENGITTTVAGARDIVRRLGFPVLVRPSYVLGGRGMKIVYSENDLQTYMEEAIAAAPLRQILIDRFLESAIEVDVDALADGKTVLVAGIMEHIEQAGVHSGDSAMCLPPHSLPKEILREISDQTRKLAMELKVKGLMNVQFAVQEGKIYILEVNPRASRTVPFVSKTIGIPLAKIAAKVMAGMSLDQAMGKLKFPPTPPYFAVKESVFPFSKFPGADVLLGPEMKSTGEVMGIGYSFGEAFAKSQLAASNGIPLNGLAFISVNDPDKGPVLPAARRLTAAGFQLVATSGTARFFEGEGIRCRVVNKVAQGSPHIVDLLESGQVQLVINTPAGPHSARDSYAIRRTTLVKGIPYFTTVAAALAATEAITSMKKHPMEVQPLQDYYKRG